MGRAVHELLLTIFYYVLSFITCIIFEYYFWINLRRIAPSPRNIYWENLTANRVWWWVRVVTLNMLVLFIVLFISTPAVVLQWLYRIPSGSIQSWQIWLQSVCPFGFLHLLARRPHMDILYIVHIWILNY